MGGASIAANLRNVRFPEHPMGGASIAANLRNVRFPEHPMGGASIAANLSSVRFAVASWPAWTRGGARSLENGEGRPNGQDGVQSRLLSPAGPGRLFE